MSVFTLTTKGNRTIFEEDGLHVGTIIEQGKPKRGEAGLYAWYAAGTGGHAASFEEARVALEQELER